jgi:protein TonB
MKRALIISAAAHLTVLILLWLVSRSLSSPVARGYPRLINATLVVKPAVAPTATSQPAAAAPKAVAPNFKPVEKKEEPVKAASKIEPKKTPPAAKPAATKPNAAASHSSSPTGSQGVAVSGGNSLKLDAPDFPFPHYIALIQFRIESNWQPPFSGQGQLLATVYFKIRRNGEVTDVKLEQSSGSIVFDQAAQRAVYSANPMPPLPAGSGLETLGVHFDFVAY